MATENPLHHADFAAFEVSDRESEYHKFPDEGVGYTGHAAPSESLWQRCKAYWTHDNIIYWCQVFLAIVLGLYLFGIVFINIWIVQPNRRVIFLYGDSLVRNPTNWYFLPYHIYTDLYYLKSSFKPEVSSWGHSLYRIADLQNNLHNKVLHRFDYSSLFTWQLADPPDAVILYWDSDVNPGPRDGSDPMNNATVAAYLDTLYDVLDTLTDRVGTVIMSGPTLSGELPRGQNPLDEALDYYAQLNNDTAALYNITYVNTRDTFFANLPEGWNETSGYLTVDGEHPNRRGSTLLRKVFREALLAEDGLW